MPENERATLRHALERLDGIETDVRMTRDGTLVLWHDADVAGIDVDEGTYADLVARQPGLTTLEALLDDATAYPGTLLNLELKSTPRVWRSWAFERRFVRAVRASGLASRVLVSSFDPLSLARVRLLDPSLRIGVLVSPDMPSPLARALHARWLHADAVHPHLSMVGPHARTRLPDAAPLHVWTAKDASDVQRAVAGGATSVIGDDPTALLTGLGRRSEP